MLYRLYFLLPDADQARRVIGDLSDHGVAPAHMHAHCRNPLQCVRLPRASMRQRMDMLHRLEDGIWRADLLVFFAALALLVFSLFAGNTLLAVLALFIMLATFLAGELFASHVPNVHLSEFDEALAHDEVLLMVDVEQDQIAKIESLVEQRHPSAVPGGSCWTLDWMGI